MRVAVLASLGVLACEPVPPQSLGDLDLPPEFRIDTSHDVVFVVDGAVAGTVDVHMPDGTRVVRGNARTVALDPIVLHVPYGTDSLDVTLAAPDGSTRVWQVPVIDGAATWDVGVAP